MLMLQTFTYTQH